ncbi:type II toxin-antitoxin system Phd/YefM family antitoxin [Sphingobium boeckii]|uniref:Antitoxin (DNA-binding transcriptional repressor) of toxin-antitoxin stability system n=1 Tax=Sphingobium boeckii TaxID=1082345 RepID=A0A7W9EF74_9SPHN|nr:hypothetical protein [Sphingobium boeckii]MBB5685431.1 antitoxin (DNA-binding transcriptional repressor) of toxin-antitoxin stability system [Sphingobium boeckii]
MMSVREFNANASKALALVEAGETLDITKDGKVIAELRPKTANKLDDPEFRASYERAVAGLKKGVPGMTGPATYEERTEG